MDVGKKLKYQQRHHLLYFNVKLFFLNLTDIESKLRRIEDDPEGSGTSHLYNIIQGVSLQANRALKPLFERQVGEF